MAQVWRSDHVCYFVLRYKVAATPPSVLFLGFVCAQLYDSSLRWSKALVQPRAYSIFFSAGASLP